MAVGPLHDDVPQRMRCPGLRVHRHERWVGQSGSMGTPSASHPKSNAPPMEHTDAPQPIVTPAMKSPG